ncbi:MAG: diphthine--ammonia ligase [Deltaproteobacteria bacterium]|nr:diphthine--ammonia ligase [Deltaproteobacteria bacterium]
MMKAFVSWSGGKEASLAYYKTLKNIEAVYLLNMISEDGRRSRSHGIDANCLRLQSEAIGIPIIQRRTSWQNYESEFKQVISDLKREEVKLGIFGDIDLQGHRDWVERVCKEMGVKAILPLWKERREKLLKDFINTGFKAIVVATQANLLGKEWLGRKIDEKFIEDLRALGNIDMCGEEGEYHTFVFDGPIFKDPLEITTGEKVLKDNHWFLEIIPKDGKYKAGRIY